MHNKLVKMNTLKALQNLNLKVSTHYTKHVKQVIIVFRHLKREGNGIT